MTATLVQEPRTQVHSKPLTALDRCDAMFKPNNNIKEQRSCSAAASVRVTFYSGILLFCGHHYTINENAIKERSLNVEDFRRPPENRLQGSYN